MEKENGKQSITIAEIAKRAGVSTATVSYVLNGRQDVKIAPKTRERILALCRELGYEKGARRKAASKKQVTIDDIAREAGVSTATVSYIVNDKKDVKISEETRKKVLQICNLRQYVPSPVARLLAGKKNNLVGICAPLSRRCAQNARYYTLLQELQRALRQEGRGTILLTPSEIQETHMQGNLEGIVCIDLTEEEFYTLKENWFVPIVAVDMIVSDPLFFKAFTDHEALISAAKRRLRRQSVTYVAYPYRNAPYADDLRNALKDDTLYLADSPSGLRKYVGEHPQEAFVFADPALAELCAPFPEKDRFLTVSYATDTAAQPDVLSLPCREMAEQAVAMLKNAVLREENKPHTFKLAPRQK